MGGEIRENINNDYENYPNKQITSEDIEKQGYKWFMRNNIPNHLENGCYVYNMDGKNGGGTHWVMFCLQFPEIYYYDSFSVNLGGYPPEELKTWGKQHIYKVIYCNDMTNQPIKSWLCGFFALYMCNKLKPLIGKLTEKKFDNVIKNSFDAYPSDGNVKEVTKFSINHHLL